MTSCTDATLIQIKDVKTNVYELLYISEVIMFSLSNVHYTNACLKLIIHAYFYYRCALGVLLLFCLDCA